MNKDYGGVYIMGNDRPTLYTGVSNNIMRRVLEHKKGEIKGFTQKHSLKKLLYYEFIENSRNAIIREKQIKNMSRAEKLTLIKLKNPYLTDISTEIFQLCDDAKSIATFPNRTPDKPE